MYLLLCLAAGLWHAGDAAALGSPAWAERDAADARLARSPLGLVVALELRRWSRDPEVVQRADRIVRRHLRRPFGRWPVRGYWGYRWEFTEGEGRSVVCWVWEEEGPPLDPFGR
jgi:hypothetical protein